MNGVTVKFGNSSLRTDSRFERWLHFSYYRFAGIKHFIFRRIRPAGMALCCVIIIAACLSFGHQKISAYLLFSFSLGMCLMSLPLIFIRRAELEGRRELPRFATAGETMDYPVFVRNIGKRPLRRAWLLDTPPDPRPSFDDFHLLKEPGENERNPFDRKFAYFRWTWLLLKNRLFVGGTSAEMINLQPSAGTRIVVTITPLRRGVIRFDALRVLLPDVFGVFQGCRKVVAPAATLIVLPRRYPLPPVALPGGATFRISGETLTNAIGNSGEFVGLRDYRPGDPLRQIHWKSWARTGRPIVKELENTYFPRYGLILDTVSTTSSDVQFEETISVAASFAAAIDTRDTLLDLMFVKTEAHRVTAGRGLERAERLLEVLAGVTPEREGNYDSLARLVLLHGDDLTSCLIIFNGWDEQRANFLKRLTSHGIVCAPIIIGVGKAPSGLPCVWLESGRIAQDLQSLPGKFAIHS